MIPPFVMIDAFVIEAFDASERMLPGRPSTLYGACGVPERDAEPGRSLECGERRPWRSIRCLSREGELVLVDFG